MVSRAFDVPRHGAAQHHPELIQSRLMAPIIVEQRCTANIVIGAAGTTDVDITGATITVTPAVPSVAFVWGTLDIDIAVAGEYFVGVLDVDGVNESAQIVAKGAVNNHRFVGTQHWLVSLTAAAHTLKLQANRNSGASTAEINAVHTKFSLLLLASDFATVDASS